MIKVFIVLATVSILSLITIVTGVFECEKNRILRPFLYISWNLFQGTKKTLQSKNQGLRKSGTVKHLKKRRTRFFWFLFFLDFLPHFFDFFLDFFNKVYVIFFSALPLGENAQSEPECNFQTDTWRWNDVVTMLFWRLAPAGLGSISNQNICNYGMMRITEIFLT